MTRDEILEKVKDGTMFTVIFTKSNGEKRTMNCRMGVSRYTKGFGKKFKDEDHDLITVYDLKLKDYRSFKASKVIKLKAHGEVYE